MSKKKGYKRSKVMSAVLGIASTILGVLVLMDPVNAAMLLVKALAAVLVIVGAVAVIGYIAHSDEASQANLFIGIIELVFGVIFFANPGAFVNWIIIFMGIFIFVTGLQDLAEANAFALVGAPSSGLRTILAVITIILGIVVIVSPFTFVDLAFTIAGISLVVNGITEIVAIFKD